MAWSSSERKKRFNPGWERTRKLILERDQYQCQWPVMDWRTGRTHKCLAYANQVDHRVRDSVHDDDSPGNLWTLCDWHHKQKTARESADARIERRERGKESRWYSHPAFG